MRATKLITLSAVAVLAGGANLALAHSMQGSLQGGQSKSEQSIGSQRGAPYARANPRELGEAGMYGEERQDRMHMRERMREIPRLSNIGNTDIRIDGYVTRGVREAAAPLPTEIQRMHPRMSGNRAFRYRDQVVILNPVTSRIVALIKTPA